MALDPVLSVGDISTTSATKQFPLGAVVVHYHETYGRQEYRYIQNTSGASLTANRGVMQEDATAVWNGILSGAACPGARFLGVRQSGVIADTYFGWILRDGYGVCASDGSTTANTAQKCAASGQFTDGVVGTDELNVFANETEAPAGAGGLFVGMVKGL